jgi:hypothetical protein
MALPGQPHRKAKSEEVTSHVRRTDASVMRVFVALPFVLVAFIASHDIGRLHLAKAQLDADTEASTAAPGCNCDGQAPRSPDTLQSEQWLPQPSVAPPSVLSECASPLLSTPSLRHFFWSATSSCKLCMQITHDFPHSIDAIDHHRSREGACIPTACEWMLSRCRASTESLSLVTFHCGIRSQIMSQNENSVSFACMCARACAWPSRCHAAVPTLWPAMHGPSRGPRHLSRGHA